VTGAKEEECVLLLVISSFVVLEENGGRQNGSMGVLYETQKDRNAICLGQSGRDFRPEASTSERKKERKKRTIAVNFRAASTTELLS